MSRPGCNTPLCAIQVPATGIDDAGVGVDDSLVRCRTNREDPLAGHEDADALLERWSRRVGEGRIPIKDESGNRHLHRGWLVSHITWRIPERVSPRRPRR